MVHSYTFDISGPVVPMNLPTSGSCCHSSKVISIICKAEVTFIMMLDDTRKTTKKSMIEGETWC